MGVGATAEERAIVPRALRAAAGAVAALAVLVAGTLGARYAGGSGARWLDHRLQELVVPTGPGLGPADAVVALGSEFAVVLVAVVMGVVALVLRSRRLALLAIVGPGLTGLATTALKAVFGRTFHGELAFPSGHTGGATALGVVTALLLIRLLRTAGATSAALLTAGALLGGGGMAVALVAERDHYPTDTIGGFCVAVAVVLVSALVIDRLAEHPRRRAGPGRPGSAVAPEP